jgi:hypothetical protein
MSVKRKMHIIRILKVFALPFSRLGLGDWAPEPSWWSYTGVRKLLPVTKFLRTTSKMTKNKGK